MPKYDPSEYDRNTPLTKQEAQGGPLLPASEEGTPGMALLRAKEMMRRLYQLLPPKEQQALLEELNRQGQITGGQLNDMRAGMRSGR